MSPFFLACFVVGLVLGVYVMLHGVERDPAVEAIPPHEARGTHDPATEPSVLFNAQNAAAFAVGFGAGGYLLARFSALPPLGVAALALLVGGIGVALSAGVLAAWVLPSARRETVDERYLLQGHPARVTTPIPADGTGQIEYEADGRRYVVGARSWDGSALAAGTDVAIERVEGGVAYVEQWAAVETRL